MWLRCSFNHLLLVGACAFSLLCLVHIELYINDHASFSTSCNLKSRSCKRYWTYFSRFSFLQKEWREDRDGFRKKVSRCVRKSQEMLWWHNLNASLTCLLQMLPWQEKWEILMGNSLNWRIFVTFDCACCIVFQVKTTVCISIFGISA